MVTTLEELKKKGKDKLPKHIGLIVDAGLVKSRSEANRLISQGAVSIDGEKATDINQQVKKDQIIKVGKRRYLKTT